MEPLGDVFALVDFDDPSEPQSNDTDVLHAWAIDGTTLEVTEIEPDGVRCYAGATGGAAAGP